MQLLILRFVFFRFLLGFYPCLLLSFKVLRLLLTHLSLDFRSSL